MTKFLRSRRRLWRKTVFLINSLFFGSWSKLFSDLRQKFWGKIVKTVFYVFMKHFDENNSMIFCFWYMFGLWAKYFLHLTKSIPKCCQNCLLNVRTDILTKKISKNFVFLNFGRNFFWLSAFSFAKLTKLLFKRSDEQFGEKCFFEKRFYNFFQTVGVTFSDFPQKSYRNVVKAVFYVLGKIFEETD